MRQNSVPKQWTGLCFSARKNISSVQLAQVSRAIQVLLPMEPELLTWGQNFTFSYMWYQKLSEECRSIGLPLQFKYLWLRVKASFEFALCQLPSPEQVMGIEPAEMWFPLVFSAFVLNIAVQTATVTPGGCCWIIQAAVRSYLDIIIIIINWFMIVQISMWLKGKVCVHVAAV